MSQEDHWKEECRLLREQMRQMITAPGRVKELERDIDMLRKAYLEKDETILILQKELALDEALIYWTMDDIMSSLSERSRTKMEKRLAELRIILLQAKSRRSDIIQVIQQAMLDIIETSPDADKSQERVKTYFAYKNFNDL